MIKDYEAICGHSTLVHEPDSNFFENNDKALEAGGLKANNEIMEEAKHEIMSGLQSQKCDRVAKPLSTEKKNGDVGNVPELHELMEMEDSLNGRENQSGDFASPHTTPVYDIKLPEKRTHFYTNKSVTECKQPELIVHLKEGSYHVVKDICVDEGVPFLDKILVDNGEVGQKGLFSFSHTELDVDSGSIKGMVGAAAPISDEVKPMVDNDCKMNVVNHCSSKNLLDRSEEWFSSIDKIVTEASDEKVAAKSIPLVKVGNSCPESSNFDGDEGQQQSDQDASKEAKMANSMVRSAAEELNGHNVNEIHINSTMERESVTSDFVSSQPATITTEEEPQNAVCQQHVQTADSPILEDNSLDFRTTSTRSFYTQHGHGESSFSVVGPQSSLVAHSGPIPYSGSLSLRSDSSTTSTHSFAFPMLHSEWNSSPVRMAKADGRHYQKQQGWKRYLLCCKF